MAAKKRPDPDTLDETEPLADWSPPEDDLPDARAYTLPDQRAAQHRGWVVKAQLLFRTTDGKSCLLDEVPRERPAGKDTLRLGPRKMRRLDDGKMVPVTPEEAPVIIPREAIDMAQAKEFQRLGALEPYFA